MSQFHTLFRLWLGFVLLGTTLYISQAQEEPFNGQITDFAVSPNGQLIAISYGVLTCGKDVELNRIEILDVYTDEVVQTLLGHTCLPNDVVWSPSGSKIASTGLDGTVRIWDVATGQQVVLGNGVSFYGTPFLSWNADETRLVGAFGGAESCVILFYDALTGERLQDFCTVEGTTVYWVAYHPSNPGVVVSGDSDGVIRFWNNEGELQHSLVIGNDPIKRFVWNSNTSLLIVHTQNHLEILNTETETVVQQIDIFLDSETPTPNLTNLSWSQDDRLIVVGDYDGNVKIFDAQTGSRVYSFTTQFSSVDAAIVNTEDNIYKLFYGGTPSNPSVNADLVIEELDSLIATPTALPRSSSTTRNTVEILDQANPLVEAFVHEDCARWCWLGIEPGVTTSEQVETVLEANEIEYTKNINPLDTEMVGYTVYWIPAAPILFPYIDDFGTTIIGTYHGVVDSIRTSVSGIPLGTILGAMDTLPTAIVDFSGDPAIVYREQGLTFIMSEQDGEYQASYLIITTPGGIDTNLLTSSARDLQPCDEPAELCQIATQEPPE